MYQSGIVQSVHNELAYVKIKRSSSCGESCASCGLCPGRDVLVSAINSANAKQGDTVLIYMSDRKVLNAALLVYIIPIIMLIFGYFLGECIFKSEILGIASGFCLMVITFVIVFFTDKYLKKQYTPNIVKII